MVTRTRDNSSSGPGRPGRVRGCNMAGTRVTVTPTGAGSMTEPQTMTRTSPDSGPLCQFQVQQPSLSSDIRVPRKQQLWSCQWWWSGLLWYIGSFITCPYFHPSWITVFRAWWEGIGVRGLRFQLEWSWGTNWIPWRLCWLVYLYSTQNSWRRCCIIFQFLNLSRDLHVWISGGKTGSHYYIACYCYVAS